MAEIIRSPRLSDQTRAVSARPVRRVDARERSDREGSPRSRTEREAGGGRRERGGPPRQGAPAPPTVAAAGGPGLDPAAVVPGALDPALMSAEPVKPPGGYGEGDGLGGASAGAVPAPPDPSAELEARARLAEERLRHLQERLAEEREAATEAGRQAGYAEGLREGHGEQERITTQLAALLDELSRQMPSRLRQCEDAAVEVVWAAVCKILGESLTTAEGAKAAVAHALREVELNDRLVVRLSPADHALMSGPDARRADGFPPGVALVADERVKLGGCLLETAAGVLDARLEVQLQRLSDVLLATRAQREARPLPASSGAGEPSSASGSGEAC